MPCPIIAFGSDRVATRCDRIGMIDRIRYLLSDYAARRVDAEGRALAAVLLLLYERDGIFHLLFTKRTELVEHHKGQISFPGGAHDFDDDDLRYTALRETSEEIGVASEDVEIIGALDEIVTISHFVVSPFVGVLRRPGPYEFRFSEFEVAEILEVPLDHLLDPSNAISEIQEREGVPIIMHSFRFGDHVIWGATARITRQFLDLLAAAVGLGDQT
jgi:8-oxo-dGTP pyrophosphatase MutT (NUDIX family)